MISLHTSPLDQPGTGDAGGMNVYVIELAKRLAQRGGGGDIFPRAPSSTLPPVGAAAPGAPPVRAGEACGGARWAPPPGGAGEGGKKTPPPPQVLGWPGGGAPPP